jgi:small-conductance mechanosensitive channel
MPQNWLIQTFLLIVIFPLLMIVLGEISLNLEKKRNRFTYTLKILRNLILPFFGLYVLLLQVIQLPKESIWVKLSETGLWITLIYFGLNLVNQILFEDAQEGSWQSNVPKLLLDLSRTFLVLVGAAIVLSRVWGADLGGLLTALGVGSLVIGLALQDSLGNVFSGITLLFEQPIKIGDWVKIGDHRGKVVEITWRSVHIYTLERYLIIVPNSELAKGNFANYSRPEPLLGINIDLSFSCDDAPYKVMDILRKTALEIDGVLANPAPSIFVIDYGDFAINYRTRLFVKDFVQGLKSGDEFKAKIWYATQRHGLTMPYPIASEYEYKSLAPTTGDLQKQALEILENTSGWESINRPTLLKICQNSVIENYAQGEIIVKAGELLKGLFVILEGQVELSFIQMSDDHERKHILGHLFTREVFGEKASLLSGQITAVTVTALKDTQVLVILPETLQSTVQTFPELSNRLGELMELRRKQIKSIVSAEKIYTNSNVN